MFENVSEKDKLELELEKIPTALYIRLSKDDKFQSESDSVLSQREILKEYLKLHPEFELFDIYIDDGCTGTNFDRPSFERMKEDIKAGLVKCVVVKDLSRFGRNYADGGYYIDDFFVHHTVRLIAINNNVDTMSSDTNAFVQCINIGITNVINESVSAATSVNVKGTLNMRRTKGEFIGSFAAYGYAKDPDDRHKLVIDEEAADVVRMIFDKYVSGMSILGITCELNEMGIPNPSAYKKLKGYKYKHTSSKITDGMWPESSVRRILKNEVYIGRMIQGKHKKLSYKIQKCVATQPKEWFVVNDTHEPIISKETFQKAQDLFNRNIRKSPNKKEVELFAGLVRCADCHRVMGKKSNHNSNRDYHYYRCETARKTRRVACTNHTIRIDKMEEAVLVFLQKMIEVATEYDEIIKAINSSPVRKKESQLIRKSMDKFIKDRMFHNDMISQLYPDWKRGDITREEYLQMKEKYTNKIQMIDEELKNLEKRAEEFENGMTENAFIENFKKLGNIEELTRPLLTELIETILVHEGGRITIRLKCKDAFEQATEYIKLNKDAVLTA